MCMATIFEFEIPTNEFALEQTLIDCPETVIEIERVVADDPNRIYGSIYTTEST